jgi:hypothetical protein
MARKKKEEIIEESVEEIKTSKIDVPEYYILRIGETLKEVAKKFGIKEEDIVKLNGEVIGTNQIRLK